MAVSAPVAGSRGGVIGHVVALDLDLVGEEPRIVPDAPDEARTAARLPGEAEEIHARLRRHAALVPGLALVVEGIDLQPAVVEGEARRPDDGRDACLGDVERQDRLANARRVRHLLARGRILRQIEAVAGGEGVRLVQHRHEVLVAAADVFDEVRREAQRALLEILCAADEDHPVGREAAEIDGMAAVGAADGNRHVLLAGFARGRIPLAEHAQPPAIVAAAIGPWRAVVRADREIDAPTGFQQFLGDLRAG